MIKNQFIIRYLLLVFAQILHSTEEAVTYLPGYFPKVREFAEPVFGKVPEFTLSLPNFIIINAIIITFFLLLILFLRKPYKWAVRTTKVIGVIEILNGLGHITMAILTWSYFSGCITGFLLVVAGMAVLVIPLPKGRKA